MVGWGQIEHWVDSSKFIGKTRLACLKINLYGCMSFFSSCQFYGEIYARWIDTSYFPSMPCMEFGIPCEIAQCVCVRVWSSSDNAKKIECVCYFRISLWNPCFEANHPPQQIAAAAVVVLNSRMPNTKCASAKLHFTRNTRYSEQRKLRASNNNWATKNAHLCVRSNWCCDLLKDVLRINFYLFSSRKSEKN